MAAAVAEVNVFDDEDLQSNFPHLVQKPYLYKSYQVFDKRKDRDPEFNKILYAPDAMLVDVVRYQLDGKDIASILTSLNVQYLVRTNKPTAKVPVTRLMGKKIALYFSKSGEPACQKFARILADVYDVIAANPNFEVVVVPSFLDKEPFVGCFSKMPWLAVPFSENEAVVHLSRLFIVYNRPVVVILDENGYALTDTAVEIIQHYGAEAYPFTAERLKEVKEQEAAAKENQSLQSILVSQTCDYVISSGRKRIRINELEGKTVGLYFYERSSIFTEKLIEVYNVLKEQGESFEIVMIPLEDEEELFREELKDVPWLSLPFRHKKRWRVHSYFEVSAIPTLVVIGPDGKTIHSNIVDAIEDYGALAFPFTAEKLSELEREEKRKHEAETTLDSLFVSGDLDFVIRLDGSKVLVSDLVGKHVLLYFSSQSRPFLTGKLAKTFESIKEVDKAFKVIWIFHNADKCSFDEHFSKISSWLALPFGDERKESLCDSFKGSPLLVAFGPDGRFITTETLEFLELYGAEAYPFTEMDIEKVEKKYAEALKKWPEKVICSFDDHELVRSPSPEYICDWCSLKGTKCTFKCKRCRLSFHPECALEEEDDD